jgi:hypothetical protein
MQAKRIVPKRLLFTGVFFLLLFAAYLHFGLLPGRLKTIAVGQIEALTPVKVDFQKALYLPFRGLSFEQLVVMSKERELIFSARKLSLDVKLIPFFKEKKIIVRNVVLDHPVYDVGVTASVLDPKTAPPAAPKTQISGQIEVPIVSVQTKVDLAAAAEGGLETFLPENVYLEQIEIANGQVYTPIEIIQDVHLKMGFQKPPLLKFQGSFRLGPKSYAAVILQGSWDLKKGAYDFHLQTESRKVPDWLKEYQKNHFLVLEKGRFSIDMRLSSDSERQTFFSAKSGLKDAKIILKQMTYEGEMALRAEGIFDFEKRLFRDYRGALDLIGVRVEGVSPEIPMIENIDGKIRFEPDLLVIESAKGIYKKIPFEANGRVESFRDLSTQAHIRLSSSVPEVLSLLSPDQKKWLEDFEIEGLCQAITTVTGSLKHPQALEIRHKILLQDGAIRNPKKKIELTGITSDILSDDEGLQIENCRLFFMGKPYHLNAFIPKNTGMPGNLELSSQDLNFFGKYLLKNETVLLEYGRLDYLGAIQSRLSGSISNLEHPYLDLAGEAQIRLEKMGPIFEKSFPSYKTMGLGGTLQNVFTLKGFWDDAIDWDANADAKGQKIFVKNKILLDSLDFQFRMKNKIIRIPHLMALGYQGTLTGSGLFDLSRVGASFDGKIQALRVDLSRLAKDLESKQKDFAGTATFWIGLSGILNQQESFRGSGAVDIRNGRLWETNLFKQMGQLPLVRVEGLDQVIIHSLAGAFEIRDKKIWTQNLSLFGNTVDLFLKGTIGLDKTLDLLMDIRYSEAILRGAQDTGGFVPTVVREAEDFIPQYKIKGTLDKPEYEKGALPVGKVIGKKIGTLLQGLME